MNSVELITGMLKTFLDQMTFIGAIDKWKQSGNVIRVKPYQTEETVEILIAQVLPIE